MKLISGIIASALLSASNTGFAEEYFCISDHEKPKHCNAGDIVLVKPTMMPRVCDFNAQILRMPKNEKTADYLCRYTGTILAVKELQKRNAAPKPMRQMPPPKKEKKMFDNMPFFK